MAWESVEADYVKEKQHWIFSDLFFEYFLRSIQQLKSASIALGDDDIDLFSGTTRVRYRADARDGNNLLSRISAGGCQDDHVVLLPTIFLFGASHRVKES